MIYLCIHVDITHTIIIALSSLLQAHAHAVVVSLVRNMAAIIKRDASDQVSFLAYWTISLSSHPYPHTLTPSHPLTPPQVLPELMVSVVAVIASMNLDTINRVVSVVMERGGGGGGGAPTAVRIAQNEVHCVHVYGNNDR